ncbi:MAG TPA: T9SS type A sorting domain-containing protein, partial [Bacteroidales bacterium]|nr:T9SS type A sorting domain-containing protein [Bacteroidales bacterium]
LWINSALVQNEEGAVLQYRTEDSQEWKPLGETGSGINWFNSDAIATDKTGWTGNTSGWKRSANALDILANKKNVKFRIVYYSKGGANAANTFAFDDVSIGKRERVSLFEYFNNLSTGTVAANTQQLNQVLASNPKDVVSIEYHTSFPGSDTLNTANTADPGSRVLYYGIGLVPYGLLNGGMNSNLVYDFSSRKPASQDIIAQSLTAVPYLLSITTEKAGGNIMGKVLLTSQGNYTNQQITLNIAVVEDVVIQSDNGALTLYNVIKKFVPSAGGTLLKSEWTRGEQIEIPFTWEFVKVYDPTKVKIVAFVQSVSSKEVLQASASEVTFTTANPPAIEDKPEVKKAIIAPNPASDMARIIFPESLKKDVRLEMMSTNGKVLKIDNIRQDVDIYELNLSEIPNGLYLIKLTSKGGETNILKLVVRK